MDRACDRYVGESKCIKCYVGSLREGDHLENLGVDGMIILKCSVRKSVGRECRGSYLG